MVESARIDGNRRKERNAKVEGKDCSGMTAAVV
jgi:hypothetical protein